jgi:hypothetical protein
MNDYTDYQVTWSAVAPEYLLDYDKIIKGYLEEDNLAHYYIGFSTTYGLLLSTEVIIT